MAQTENEHDVVVIGGGPAWLADPVTLGRSRRTLATVDGGQPRNAPAGGVHGYLTRDRSRPRNWCRSDGHTTILAFGPMSVHQALLFRQLTDRVTCLSHALPPTPEQEEQAPRPRAPDRRRRGRWVEVDEDRVTGVRLAGGTAVECQAVAVATCCAVASP